MARIGPSKKLLFDILVILIVFIILFVFYAIGKNNVHNQPTNPKPVVFNSHQYSLSEPSSIWVIFNKQRPIENKNYIPPGLVSPKVLISTQSEYGALLLQHSVSNALTDMFNEASKEKISLALIGGYHSLMYQTSIYTGQLFSKADPSKYSNVFKPGYDETQAGLSAAIGAKNNSCNKETCFASTHEGIWLYKNAYKYGFIVRYPNNHQSSTGIEYEPWLYRYVGNQLAAKLYNNKQSMEEFFSLPSAVNYK
jgi:D-alanyl-D-alanine carboxypeptidase